MYESTNRQLSELDTHGIVIISSELELKEVGTTHVVNFSGRYVEKTKNPETGVYDSKAHFFQFEIWDTAAEYLVKNSVKGDMLVLLSATPREHTWEKEGKKFSRIVFRVNRFKIVKYSAPKTEEV